MLGMLLALKDMRHLHRKIHLYDRRTMSEHYSTTAATACILQAACSHIAVETM